MLFNFDFRSRAALRRTLHAAIAAHRPAAVRHLLDTHGRAAFLAVLASSRPRVVADALSMLPPVDRVDLSRRLQPRPALRAWRKLLGPSVH